MLTIEIEALQRLLGILTARGYALLGPTLREGAVVFDAIQGVEDLPSGWTDVQAPASYRLRRRDDGALFGYTIGPVSWKKFLFPPRVRLFAAQRNGKGFDVVAGQHAGIDGRQSMAFIGIRACELRALALHDRVFMGGESPDPTFKAIRESTFIVAVECLEPGGNCFCGSMGTGPAVEEGFDLALTELASGGPHRFLVRAGTSRGEEVLCGLDATPAGEEDVERRREALAKASGAMGREVAMERMGAELTAAFEHAEWDEVAKRCLACANCTMVCPTCFCSTVEDTTDLAGERAERWRRWDSCFTADFTKVAGGNIRSSTRARYRQWVMHKFAYWAEQFGAAGCVGCGRCITWCPAGIDLTAELGLLRNTAVQSARQQD
jgi:ferredoxin